MLLSSDEAARRARAAIAYSGLEHDELRSKTDLDISKIRRIVSRTNPRGASVEELWAIADACGVPRSFMEEGFSEPGSIESADARLAELEDRMAAVAVLLPILLDATGYQLPARGAQALERALGTTAQADR